MGLTLSQPDVRHVGIVVDVAVMSAQKVSPESDLTASVQSLAERAQRALGVVHGRLFSLHLSFLDGDLELGTAKLQNGDCLTLQAGTPRIHCGCGYFATILGDGSLVTWGSASSVGDSSGVQDQHATDPRVKQSFCCHPGRWVCRHMGQCILWW